MADLVPVPNPQTNPLFLHPNESPALVLVSPLLNGENYHSWARGMKMALISKNKLGFIDGSIPPPNPDKPTFAAWQRCDTMVMAWIQKSISTSIVKSIIWIELARDTWLDLQERFSQGDVFRISDLMEEAFRLHQGDRSVVDYYTHLKTVWNELDNLKPLPNCICVVPCVCGAITRMREYREQEQVIRFLRGLTDQFAFSSVFNVTNRRGGPSYGGQHGPSYGGMHGPSYGGQNGGRFTGTFNGRGKGRSFGGRSQPNRICTHCGRSNHTIETCYQLHGFPPSYRASTRTSNTNAASTDSNNFHQDVSVASQSEPYMHMTESEYHQLMELLHQSPPTGPLTALATNHVSNMAQVSSINTAERNDISGSPNTQWIVDTGATDHITHSISAFASIHAITPLSVILPSGSQVYAHYSGTIHLTSDLILHDTLYIPQFHVNLISVSKLITTLNCSLTFDSALCFIKQIPS
ncbi:uncharacterized protein LOC133294823 [Gastrolobium bilobum]|uniref:uncharacterized protein LOC133294823 n=1 Tax=Gastrolobium bilobum TaxID=150636 RepID=UPI002AB1AF8F|nr:uncharacterized protein LOC133294823 [Gastrolobium bilobum]